jgi:hypothetical protein
LRRRRREHHRRHRRCRRRHTPRAAVAVQRSRWRVVHGRQGHGYRGHTNSPGNVRNRNWLRRHATADDRARNRGLSCGVRATDRRPAQSELDGIHDHVSILVKSRAHETSHSFPFVRRAAGNTDHQIRAGRRADSTERSGQQESAPQDRLAARRRRRGVRRNIAGHRVFARPDVDPARSGSGIRQIHHARQLGPMRAGS